MLKLIAIVGTNSKRSTNRQFASIHAKNTLLKKLKLNLLKLKTFPVFNKPADKQVPAEILEIAAKIEGGRWRYYWYSWV